MCDFDGAGGKSDCAVSCTCSSSELSNGLCDAGKPHSACNTAACGWDGGDCGYCSTGCEVHIGFLEDLGNQHCDPACDTELCYWDWGDCVSPQRPVTVYVSSISGSPNYSSLHSVYSSVLDALLQVWAPYTTVYLLSGTHQLRSPTISSPAHTLQLPASTVVDIATLLCEAEQRAECASEAATVALTRTDVSVVVAGQLILRNLKVAGGFPLKDNCDAKSCVYCPAVHLNLTTNEMNDDRNVEISVYSEQSLCDRYKTSSLFQMAPDSVFNITNVTFMNLRHQPNALILNQCGHLGMRNVTFTNVMTYRRGLKGGVIQQEPMDDRVPYYCGTFAYSGGLVELLNNGYEFAEDSYYSGFMWLQQLRLVILENVRFEYNYMVLGKSQRDYGSALLFIEQMREVRVSNCTFFCNLADTGAAIYISTSLEIPIVPINGISSEHALTHITIENCWFEKNSGRKGAVIFIEFFSDHQNVVMRNNTFINNFATEMGIVDMDFAFLTDTYAKGATLQMLINEVLEEVFIPPVSTSIINHKYISDYCPVVSRITNVANFLMTGTLYYDCGDSMMGLDYSQVVIKEFYLNPRTYMSSPIPRVPPSPCVETIRIDNSYNSTLFMNNFESMSCQGGSPGPSISGTTQFVLPTQINLSSLTFRHNQGFGLLALTTSLDVHLDNLSFINNTNANNEFSVCLDITQTIPSVINISNSLFKGNAAVYSTLARVDGARGVRLTGITAIDNVASSTSAGLIFTPPVGMDSFVTVSGSIFHNNTSLRSGVIYVTENSGNMLFSSSHVTITITNNTFSNNNSRYGGCSLSISGFVVLSASSIMQGNVYSGNVCREGGAGAYITFIAGVMTIEDNLFDSNSGQFGTAIYSTHQGAEDGKTFLAVRKCVFRNNDGSSTVHIAGTDIPLIYTDGNLFIGNRGTSLYISAAAWIDRNSLYQGNCAGEGSVLIALDYSNVSIEGAVSESNSASIKGGVASISIGSSVACSDCQFRRNRCDKIGGVVSIDQSSVFNCSNCQFSENYAELKGSVIYSIFSSVMVAESSLVSNFAHDFGTVVLIESSAEFVSTTVANNSATTRSPGVIQSMSNFTATNCTFANQTGSTGAFFFGSIQNQLIIEDSDFSHGVAAIGGVMYLTTNSSLVAIRSRFTDCSASEDSSFALLRSTSVTLREVTVLRLVAPHSYGALSLLQSTLIVDSSLVVAVEGSFASAQTSNVTFVNSTFDGNIATNGPSLNCIDCYKVTIVNCTLTNNSAKQGGAVYVYTSGFLGSAPSAVVTGNLFRDNRAVNGGAMFFNGIQIAMSWNRFLNNSAKGSNYEDSGLLNQGIGGAVYMVCEFIIWCSMRVESNSFEANSAERRGGAAYWFDSYPHITRNQMTSNSAKYGSDIASFPIQLVPLTANHEVSEYITNSSVPLVQSIENAASGHLSPEVIVLALMDHYGNVVSDDSSSSAQIIVTGHNVSVAGNTQVVASEGVFSFSNLIFKGAPQTSESFEIATTGVDPFMKMYTQDPNTYIATVSVAVGFRPCVMGESLQDVECYVCPEGTFSLDPSEPCSTCPSHVTCYGNFTMTPDSGYWRPDPTLDLWFACPNPDACLGSPQSLPRVSLTGVCADGYEGNLCNSCVSGFSRQGKDMCSRCPSLTSNVIVSTLITLLALSLGGLIITIAIRGASRPRSELAIHLKIFMNYLQMVVVAASLNLNWPDFVSIFLNGQDTAGSVTEQFFSFDCIMQRLNEGSVYYTKLRANALLPAGLLFLIMSVWSLIRVCSRVTQLLHKLVASLVMIIFVLHPSLTKVMFAMFSCKELKPGELWLISDLSLRCWSSDHVTNTLFVALPSIAVWIFGLPLLCLLVIFRLRRKLSDPLTQLKFSFLYKGYHQKWFFWEFAILYRKVALVCASVFLSTVSIMVQALSVLAVLLISLFFQLQVQPFSLPIFNRLELKSILVSSVTIYSGLFYQTESIRKRHTALEVKVLLFVAILCTNSYFLLSWIRCVLPLLIETIRRRFLVFSKRYAANDVHRKRATSSDYMSSLNASKGVSQEDSSVSQSRVTPLNVSDVPQNSPSALEAEYSQPQEDPSEQP